MMDEFSGYIARRLCRIAALEHEYHKSHCLYAALKRQQARLSVASDGQRMQPVFALLPRDLLADLQDFLNNGGRKIDSWYLRHKTALADLFSVADSFLNINSHEDLLRIEKKPRQRPSW